MRELYSKIESRTKTERHATIHFLAIRAKAIAHALISAHALRKYSSYVVSSKVLPIKIF